MSEILDIAELVMVDSGEPITDSRRVARRFGKRHDHVLRSIRALLKKLPKTSSPKFGECFDINHLANGKAEPFYRMNKDAFMLLAMGFTGDRALIVKLAFIDAFNRMARFIRSQQAGGLERWEAAFKNFQSDQEHVSHCGKDLANWKTVKPCHLALLDELNPQIKLPLDDDSEED